MSDEDDRPENMSGACQNPRDRCRPGVGRSRPSSLNWHTGRARRSFRGVAAAACDSSVRRSVGDGGARRTRSAGNTGDNNNRTIIDRGG